MSAPNPVHLYGDLGTGHSAAQSVSLRGVGLRESWLLFLGFLAYYIRSRPWMMLLVGFPAIMASLFGVFLYWEREKPDSSWSLRTEYEIHLGRSIQSKQWDHARVSCDALLAHEPGNLEYLFQRSLIAAEEKEMDLAQSLLVRVTRLDAAGFPAARKVRAQQHLALNEIQPAIRQMRKALEESPNDISIPISLGTLLLQTGETAAGLELLEMASGKETAVRVQLAQYYQGTKRNVDAERHFRVLAPEFERRWVANHRWEDAAMAAAARSALHDWKTAEKVLLEAIKEHEKEPKLREVLAQVYVEQAAEAQAQKQVAQQWKLLERALTIAPNNVSALQQVAELMFSKDAVAESAKSVIAEVIASGQAPASIHLIIGTRAVVEGDLAKAELHLDQAHASNPNSPIVMNNLAWVMAHQDPPQLEQAHTVIDTAVKLAPTHPEILDTRAMICLKQGDAKQAIRDLESAIKIRPDHVPYKKRLVEAYRAAGDRDTAETLEKAIAE